MPEAVIVATARSPIGRAYKGSLTRLRPDDLAATIVRAALDQVPALDPADIDDLLPRLRAARRRAGLQHGPGRRDPARPTTTCRARPSPATARRACRPPGWRSTRSRPARAMCSSRPASSACPGSPRATPTGCPDTHEPRLRRGPGPYRGSGPRAAPTVARPARGRRRARHLHGDGPDRREPRAAARHCPARSSTSSAYAARTSPRRRSPTGSGQREITPVTTPAGDRRERRRRAAGGRHLRGRLAAQAGLPPRRHRHRRQLLPAQRRRGRRGRDVRHQGPRTRHHAAGPDRVDRRHRAVAGDHGAGPGRGVPAGARPGRHDRSTTSTWSRSTRRSPPRWCRRTPISASTSTGSTSTAARSRSVTRSA